MVVQRHNLPGVATTTCRSFGRRCVADSPQQVHLLLPLSSKSLLAVIVNHGQAIETALLGSKAVLITSSRPVQTTHVDGVRLRTHTRREESTRKLRNCLAVATALNPTGAETIVEEFQIVVDRSSCGVEKSRQSIFDRRELAVQGRPVAVVQEPVEVLNLK